MEHTERLTQEPKMLVADVEELLTATAAQTGERIEKARACVGRSMRAASARLLETAQTAGTRARAAAEGVDGLVHRNPWPAIGAAAGAGMLAGFLLARK